MPHSKWKYANVLLLACVAAAQAIGNDAPADMKRDMVRIVLDGELPALSPANFTQAIERAAEIHSFSVDSLTSAATIVVQTRGRVSGVDVFQTANGAILTIQMYNAIVIPEPSRTILDGGNLLGGLTAYLARVEPQFVSRLDIQLLAPATASTRIEDESVTISLAPTASATSLASGPSDESFELAAKEYRLRLSAELGVSINEIGARLAKASQALEEKELVRLASSLDRAARDDGHAANVIDDGTRAQRALVASEYRDLAFRFAAMMDDKVADKGSDAKATNLDACYESYNSSFASLRTHAKRVEQQIDRFVTELSREEVAGSPLADLDRQLARLASGNSSIASLSPVLELEEALNVMQIENADRGANAVMTDRDAPMRREGIASSRQDHAYADYFTSVTPDAEALRKAEEAGIIVLAQAQEPAEAEELQPAPSEVESKAGSRRELNISGERTAVRPRYTLYNPDVPAMEDPLQQPVNIDFRDMPLANVVNLLATKAGINVIAGTEVTGTVTANLQDIALGQAIEIVLRQNGLGIVEEAGIYRITTYEEAVASRRDTKMIFLDNASAVEVQTTIQQIVQGGGSGAQLLSVSANETSNIIILSGPSELVQEFEEVVYELDIAEPVIPTRTATIKLNYSSPDELLPIITPLVSEAGKATGDPRSNTLVVTDIPIKVEEIQRVVNEIDVPVKQVSISTMIVDAKLADDAQTGIDWTVNAIRHTNSRGQVIGNLDNLTSTNDFTTGPPTAGIGINSLLPPSGFVQPLNLGAQVAFGVISGDIDIDAVIGAQVQADNADLLANPTIITVENKEARISIAEEIPFQELTQSTTGPPISSTEFKEVGTILSVTAQVPGDDHIIVDVDAKQSDTKGESVTGVPPEDKREVTTQLRVKNGQTIFIGGLRRFDDESSTRKTPVLGDIPVLGLLFKKQSVVKEKVELLIFMTAHILPDEMPELTPGQQQQYDRLGGVPENVDATKQLWRNVIRPQDQRDPFWKWQRAK